MDDIFELFSVPDLVYKFKEYLSSKHHNKNFSVEKEKDGCLPFLDVTFFVKRRNFQLPSIEKRPSVGFIPTPADLYLQHIKLF